MPTKLGPALISALREATGLRTIPAIARELGRANTPLYNWADEEKASAPTAASVDAICERYGITLTRTPGEGWAFVVGADEAPNSPTVGEEAVTLPAGGSDD